MQFIDFIFGVIRETSPIQADEASKLRSEIQTDWDNVVTDETHEGFKPGIKTKLVKVARSPYFRLFLAISFLFWVKQYRDWYEGKFDEWRNKEENN